MFITQGNFPGAAATAAGVVVDSITGTPKLRFEYRLPKIEGNVQGFNYVGLDIKIVVEVTVHPQLPLDGRYVSPQPVADERPSGSWAKPVAIGLLASATIIVVGTIIEDFFTAGAGVVDDAPSFAGAAALWARGMQIFRTASALTLPRAIVPATAGIVISVQWERAPAKKWNSEPTLVPLRK